VNETQKRGVTCADHDCSQSICRRRRNDSREIEVKVNSGKKKGKKKEKKGESSIGREKPGCLSCLGENKKKEKKTKKKGKLHSMEKTHMPFGVRPSRSRAFWLGGW
jgi:hypothetical protein